MDVDRLLELEEDVAFRVNALEAGKRLDRVVAERVPWAARSAVTGWIRAGRARVDGAAVVRAGRIVQVGQQVEVRVVKTRRDLEAPIEDLLAIPLVHRGRDFVVADKPHGVASHPGGGVIKRTLVTALAVALRGAYEPGGPWLPHRLDRETAGLSIVALERAAMVRLSEAFASGRIRRFYTARVRGQLAPTQEWVDLRFGLRELAHRPKRMAIDPAGLPAHTRMRALASDGATTRVRLEAVTGRQHQLRLHLAHIGHAILGDLVTEGRRAGRRDGRMAGRPVRASRTDWRGRPCDPVTRRRVVVGRHQVAERLKTRSRSRRPPADRGPQPFLNARALEASGTVPSRWRAPRYSSGLPAR